MQTAYRMLKEEVIFKVDFEKAYIHVDRNFFWDSVMERKGLAKDGGSGLGGVF